MARLSPRMLFDQATAALRSGKTGMAANLAEEMVRHMPNDHNTWVLRGKIRLIIGMLPEAVTDLERALKLRPRDIAALITMGNAYQGMGEHRRAIAQFDKALRSDPRALEALAGKLTSLESQGEQERAMKLLKRKMTGDIPPLKLAAVYMRLLNREKQYEQVIEIGRALEAEDHAPSQTLRDTLFALAIAYERSEQYQQAVDTGFKANAILAADFRQDTFLDMCEELRRVFTAERMNAIPRAAIDTSAPIFVVGMPRCGSTLVERILHSHPHVYGSGELATFHLMVMNMTMRIGSIDAYPRSVAHLQQHVVDAEARAYLDVVSHNAGNARRIVDKHLGNGMHLGMIDAYLPQSHVVFCTRNPLDQCLSCFLERLSASNIRYASNFDDLAFYYAQYHRLVRDLRDVVHVACMEVPYEHMVAQQEQATRQLIEFCGLDWDDRCLRFYETRRAEQTLSYDQVTRPIYSSSTGRAARFGAALDPLREALERHGVTWNEQDAALREPARDSTQRASGQ